MYNIFIKISENLINFVNNTSSVFFSFVLNTIFLLMIVLVGGVLPLFERKFLSLTQRRVGPKFVGYKGRLQFLADALKVLLKEFITILKVNNFYFFFLPTLYLNVNLLLWFNIILLPNSSLFNIEFNIVFLLILNIIIHLIITITGFILKNKYTIIASSRVLNICFSLEIFIMLVDTFFLVIFKTFSIPFFFTLNNYSSLISLSLIMIPFLVLYFLMETSKTPFDQVEAETEIIMGYHVEYSGFLFGVYVLSEYFHVVTSLYLLSFLLR